MPNSSQFGIRHTLGTILGDGRWYLALANIWHKQTSLVEWDVLIIRSNFHQFGPSHSLLLPASPHTWQKFQEGVDEIAINDAFLIEMLVYRVLKRHFWMEPYYMDAWSQRK